MRCSVITALSLVGCLLLVPANGWAQPPKPTDVDAVSESQELALSIDPNRPSQMLELKTTPVHQSNRLSVLVFSLTIFVLAVFVGFEVIAKVPPTLHTPLMSGSNAISGITVVGALIAAGNNVGGILPSVIGMAAVIFAMINVCGGFLVTNRMLRMFKKR